MGHAALDWQHRDQTAGPSGIDQLERPRPDHTDHARLSFLPRTVSGPEQPSRHWSHAADVDRRRIPGMAVVGRRRTVFQSRTRPGIRYWRHIGPRGILQRRSAEGRRGISEVSRTTLFLPSDIRSWRRAGRRCRRRQSIARQARHRPRHGHGGPIFRGRLLRRQFLREGSAHRLHELGHVVVRGLRFPSRFAGLHARRRH